MKILNRLDKTETTILVVIIAIIILFILAIAGWILNIAAIFAFATPCQLSFELVLRLIGIFIFPLGAVIGYF